MPDHPETYTLTREEWSAINRALAGAALGASLPRSNAANVRSRDRLACIREAQDILSAAYDRAAGRPESVGCAMQADLGRKLMGGK